MNIGLNINSAKLMILHFLIKIGAWVMLGEIVLSPSFRENIVFKQDNNGRNTYNNSYNGDDCIKIGHIYTKDVY